MFVPLHDGLPLAHIKAPLATRALIGACVMGYVLVALNLLPLGPEWLAAGLGVVPAVLFGTEALPEGLPLVPEPLTLVTSQFMHGSWMHLGGNMLFLWVYGDNVEDAMGHRRFLLFFLLCGAFAGFAHAWMDPESTRPLIGASGAVAGIVAAYVILYPRQKLWGLVAGIPLRIPASMAIGLWVLTQLVSAFFSGDANVGWFAHLGGLVAGAALIPLMRRRYDPVLARIEATRQGAAR